ncbi:uncharacterized protein LOC143621404 [Bidens hawaiensis]|uniref:uncharacterized protein LOC143621404 n=1 Tax=Bidens hawaiensis TaxID=980011 RepID=UPI004049A133
MDDNKESISSGESRDLGESGTKLLLKFNGANRVVEDVSNNNININNGTVIVVSPSVTVETSSSTSSVAPAVGISNNKRQGLRKWKRIPRELAMKTTNLINNKENGDWNVSPVREMVVNGNGDGDSDLSSRSSTALASPPRSRIGSGKKPRGFNMQEEESLNSNSNSAVVFVQGSNSLASRSRQSEPSAKYDEKSSDDKDLNEEAQVAFVKSDVESDDALVESIKGLHFAQEEFEKEVLKWRDVGKDDPLLINDPLREILELKDAKISELELALSSEGFKTEMEDCLMKMIQADVENVVITATTRRLIEGPLREIQLKLQEKNVLSEDVQTKKQDDKLEMKESVKKLPSRVCRFTLCFVIQFILLFVTLYLKSSPQIVEVVPT